MLRCNTDLPCFLLPPPLEGALETLELSQQERQIVRLILLGCNSTGMMNALHIRLGTLRTHKRHIFAKLGVHKQSQLAAVVLARASESQKANSRDEIVERSFDTRRRLRHKNGELVAEKHLAAEYPGT